ncbi:MAG: ROK family protein [Candidatus Azobacteroides sp.]|nr:ROK family protein [Candidatus Azobacteroides sp.]
MKIGIDLGGTNVRVALVDKNGVRELIKEPCKADKSVEETTGHLKEMIRKIIHPKVKGIGLGVPSAVDSEKGIVYNVNNIPSWKEVHLKEILEKEFNIPVHVNNDANCFALGEKHYGAGKSCENMIGIALGTGLGAGVVLHGKLYGGSHSCAGEIGCVPYRDGTFEHYCSSRFFSRFYRATGMEVYDAAMRGNAEARKVWSDFGEHIGNLLTMVLFVYDPQVIVFGGSIANAFDFFAPAMYDRLKEFLFPDVVKNVIITPSRIQHVGILGAASLISHT